MLPSSGYFKNLHCPYYKSGFCCRPHCHYKHAHSTSTTSYTNSTKATYVPTPIIKNIPEYKPTPIAELRKRKVGESLGSSEPLVKVKKEPPSSNDNDLISSIIGSKVNSSKVKVKEEKSKSNNCKKEKSSKVLGVTKPIKTKTQLIAEKEEELRKKKSSKDLTKSDSSNIIKSEKASSSSEGKHTKEISKSSSVKTPSNSTSKSSNDDKKSLISSTIKLDDSSSFLSLSSSAAPISDTNKKSPTKQQTLSDNNDDDLAKLLESPPVDDDLVILSVAKKSRVAHSGPSELTLKLAANKKPAKMTPSQTMYNRFNNITNNKESTIETSTNDISAKKRVAHNIVSKTSQISSSPQKATPIVPTKKRPVIPAEFGGKIPMVVRTRYLNSIIDELLKFCSEDESYSRGLIEEKTIYSRSTSKNVYLNLAVNAIKRIRNEANAKSTNKPDQQLTSKVSDQSTIASLGNRPVSHTMILNGPHAEGCSIEKRRSSITVQDLTDIQLYTALKRYIMSVNKLAEYGYPRPDPLVAGKAILPPSDSKCKNNFTSTRRVCYRCMKTFNVDEFGYPLTIEPCIYHSGRLWSERFNRSIEKKYSCCKGDSTTGGCCSGKSHVVDGSCHPNYLLGYVQTGPKSPDANGFHGIYALDCEMSYTTIGLELTRVSVIDHKQKCVYESLVKPDNPVLDYNTKFSGIKEGDLDQINVSLKDVQQKLLSLIGDKTILIGHSLESDLKALKIIHDTVIDTAEVFPHRRGLPFKRALRTLMAEFMQSIIQNDVDGHDSQEDAVACMKLILWKVQQDLSKIKR